MRFSFGIVTEGKNEAYLTNLIQSIKKQNIPEYEIIVCGGSPRNDVKFIDFSEFENTKSGWLNKKKNMLAFSAIYENFFVCHDYFLLDDNWYKGFCEFGDNWDIVQNKIFNIDGSRFSDWVLNRNYLSFFYLNNIKTKEAMKKMYPNYEHDIEWIHGVPYDCEKLKKLQYISGGQIICKTEVMKQDPLDENLLWGQGDDIEWSNRVLPKYNVKMNLNSVSFVQKPKWTIDEIPQFLVEELGIFFNNYM